MPYNIYTENNIKVRFIKLEEIKKQHKFNKKYLKQFITNIKKWNCLKNNKVDIIKYSSIADGNELHLEIKVFFGLFKINWIAKIENVIKEKEFSDLQIKGPFKFWHHRHAFIAAKSADECIMEDQINFILQDTHTQLHPTPT